MEYSRGRSAGSDATKSASRGRAEGNASSRSSKSASAGSAPSAPSLNRRRAAAWRGCLAVIASRSVVRSNGRAMSTDDGECFVQGSFDAVGSGDHFVAARAQSRETGVDKSRIGRRGEADRIARLVGQSRCRQIDHHMPHVLGRSRPGQRGGGHYPNVPGGRLRRRRPRSPAIRRPAPRRAIASPSAPSLWRLARTATATPRAHSPELRHSSGRDSRIGRNRVDPSPPSASERAACPRRRVMRSGSSIAGSCHGKSSGFDGVGRGSGCARGGGTAIQPGEKSVQPRALRGRERRVLGDQWDRRVIAFTSGLDRQALGQSGEFRFGMPCRERLKRFLRSGAAAPATPTTTRGASAAGRQSRLLGGPAGPIADRDRHRRRRGGRSPRPCRHPARSWSRASRYRRRNVARRNDGSR